MTDREAARAIELAVAELPAVVPLERAADFLGVSTRTLRRYVAKGKLRILKTGARGGLARVLRADLQRLLEDMLRPCPFNG